MTSNSRKSAGPLGRVFGLLSSYGLSVAIFLLLFLLTFLGTLEQTKTGLYAAQTKYFESFFLVHYLFDTVPLALPGGYLLMILLTVNLVCGGVVRMRKGWTQLGVLIVHAGILVLMAGSFITFNWSTNGFLQLYEGQSSDEFVSYHDWEITITEASSQPKARQLVIPEDDFKTAATKGHKTFTNASLPFSVTLSGYALNSAVRTADTQPDGAERVVNGQFLESLSKDPKGESDIPGLYLTAEGAGSGEKIEAILWAAAMAPVPVNVNDEAWLVELRRRRWQLPFTVQLDKFTRELHPGTSMPRVFRSDITKVEEGLSQKHKISMNEPLRHKGYTLFQSSWGPQNARPGERLYSQFSVVRNPADAFPLYACVIITLGLALHFSVRLVRHLMAESRRRA